MVTSIKGNATSTFGGNVDVTGNVVTDAPAFSAYLPSNQSISSSAWTKVAISTEEFDTANCFDTSNYRFTPTVAGYYQVNGSVYMGGIAFQSIGIYKNGSVTKMGGQSGGAGYNLANTVSALVYLNGTTDYIELYAFHAQGTTQTITTSIAQSFFQASLVRAE